MKMRKEELNEKRRQKGKEGTNENTHWTSSCEFEEKLREQNIKAREDSMLKNGFSTDLKLYSFQVRNKQMTNLEA